MAHKVMGKVPSDRYVVHFAKSIISAKGRTVVESSQLRKTSTYSDTIACSRARRLRVVNGHDGAESEWCDAGARLLLFRSSQKRIIACYNSRLGTRFRLRFVGDSQGTTPRKDARSWSGSARAAKAARQRPAKPKLRLTSWEAVGA
jgi:hypothetical protein